MILTGALALSATVGVTMFAASRGHSPVTWGGASLAISGASMLVAWIGVAQLGGSDWVFDPSGGALAMLVALAGPSLALLGNLMLVSRLAAQPAERVNVGSSWSMWKLGDIHMDGCACTLTSEGGAIIGRDDGTRLFAIPHAQVSAIDVDGETLLLRTREQPPLRLVLANGDPDHRDARIQEIRAIADILDRARLGIAR